MHNFSIQDGMFKALAGQAKNAMSEGGIGNAVKGAMSEGGIGNAVKGAMSEVLVTL